MHKSPKKKIGGLSLIILIFINSAFFFYNDIKLLSLTNLLFLLIIFLINLIDDLINISAIVRLLLFSFFYFFVLFINFDLKFYFALLVLTLIFLKFSIFTNFNDGGDFYISLNYIFLIVGILLYNFIYVNNSIINYLCIIYLSFLFSFYFFNFPPAKVFLGDTGAYLLSLFSMMIFMINKNFDIIFLTFYFLSPILIDSLFTLSNRILLKKNIFKSHNEHFFQRVILKKNHLYLIKNIFFLHTLNFFVYAIFLFYKFKLLPLLFFSLFNYYLYRLIINKNVLRV